MTETHNRPCGKADSRHQRVGRMKMILEIIDMNRQGQFAKMAGTPLSRPVDDQNVMAKSRQARRDTGISLAEFGKAGTDDNRHAPWCLRRPVMAAHLSGIRLDMDILAAKLGQTGGNGGGEMISTGRHHPALYSAGCVLASGTTSPPLSRSPSAKPFDWRSHICL